jgi:anaphase-promoting complex subunit 4
LVINYVACDSKPSTPKPTIPATILDLSPGSPHASIVVHRFALHGPKARPIHVDVNGRRGRRAVCVLYGDAMRYEVLDLDAAMGEDEEHEEYGDEAEEYGEEEEEEEEVEEVEEVDEEFDSDEENDENENL